MTTNYIATKPIANFKELTWKKIRSYCNDMTHLSSSPRLYRLFMTEMSLSLAESFSGVTYTSFTVGFLRDKS